MASLVYAAASLFEVGKIYAKARLAQVLLEQAWQQSIEEQQPIKAWPWADTWPVARLSIPSQQQSLIVLASDSGESLAFGPGLNAQSVAPGEPGLTLISGHNDTHFVFLEKLEVGESITLSSQQGEFHYQVEQAFVVLKDDFSPSLHGDNPLLILSTCYPFSSSGIRSSNEETEYRYLVVARQLE